MTTNMSNVVNIGDVPSGGRNSGLMFTCSECLEKLAKAEGAK